MSDVPLVDSNVCWTWRRAIQEWGRWSTAAHSTMPADESLLVINPMIYAEVSIGYHDRSKSSRKQYFRLMSTIGASALPYEAAFLAGKSFRRPTDRRGGRRASPLPDFYIGATRRCAVISC